jgi:hypothetical protein
MPDGIDAVLPEDLFEAPRVFLFVPRAHAAEGTGAAKQAFDRAPQVCGWNQVLSSAFQGRRWRYQDFTGGLVGCLRTASFRPHPRPVLNGL